MTVTATVKVWRILCYGIEAVTVTLTVLQRYCSGTVAVTVAVL